MKTILVINDFSAEAANAINFAFSIAKKVKADILVADTVFCSRTIEVKSLQLAGSYTGHEATDPEVTSFEPDAYYPAINNLDVSGFSEDELAGLIIKNGIWLMVKGISANAHDIASDSHLNAQGILNRVRCPLLLVPENFKPRDFERLTYVADLRYCRLQIVKYLAELAAPYDALLQIANIAAKGMPEMDVNYSKVLFNEIIGLNIQYDNLLLNNIRERDLKKAIDVMVNALHTDLLILVNHRFHFEEVFGRYLPDTLPQNMNVPLLVFPC
ncbi:hypothetical protein [Mucilaginibacter sp. L3T2-6]|uniref:hypothetical protein n=1 Tax=Mucilaginibacter sp. L3T2-6 TaxID=3062491 RepID=UPI0026752F44|nr:hypothetical protein [Mucilaginibacter sp. L3T2-6]MDO3642193.1 hypothetical protein [Mucilaginibacter sp. L3T2-6]MDV6214688.1 hypothetical protein [Mucilaginibacter sp. L3T2-6]